MAHTRKYVSNARFGAVAKASPRVSVGFVFAGETWTIFFWERIGCTVCATDEFSVPTTPTTFGSDDSFVAAWAPLAGLASSSCVSTTSL